MPKRHTRNAALETVFALEADGARPAVSAHVTVPARGMTQLNRTA